MTTAAKTPANYSVFRLQGGEKLRNNSGTRTATFITETKRGYKIEITDKNGTYFDTVTWRQLPQRFPVLIENARYEVTNLTAEQLQVIMDTFGGITIDYKRVA